MIQDLENSVTYLKRNNIQIIGIPDGEKREKEAEGLCEQIIVENFPNLGKDTDIEILKAQRTPMRFNKNHHHKGIS